MNLADRILAKTDARTRLLAKNVVGSVVIKGWASLVVFLLVPLTLRVLGAYANGLWMTLSVILVWFDQMDVGLGNGLRNRLAACMAHGETERAREAVSSTMAMLAAIVIPVAAVLLIIVWQTDVYALLGVAPERIADLREVLSAVVILFASTFVLRLVGNVYMGLQLPAANSAIVAAGQTLALIGTAVVYFAYGPADGAATAPAAAPLGSRLMAIAVVNTAAPLAVFALAFAVTFGRRYPALRPRLGSVSLATARELVAMGVKFFVLQVAGIILFTSSNLLIQHLFSPEAVTPYQIAYRYFTIVMMIFGIVAAPFWSATTDAYERGDMEWIVSSGRRLDRCLWGLYALIAVMVGVSSWFYALWVGREVTIPLPLTAAMGLYTVVFITSIRYSTFLNGCGKLHLQLVMTVAAAVLFIPLSVFAVRASGSLTALVLVMAAVNVPGLVVNMVQYRKVVRRTARGVWDK